jgi:CheY-like chemotaxis protein
MPEKKKILVVEDHDQSRELLVLYIRRLGYEVSGVVDGAEALEHVAAKNPNLILMDLSMPRLGGLEAIACLKADSVTKDIPVIVTTAFTESSQSVCALEAGALEVLLKPLDFIALGESIARYLREEEKTTIPPETNCIDQNIVDLEKFGSS